jgi:predicted nucleic acid-binding protein
MWEMSMKVLRIYVDTSVIGGCLDEEFAADSLRVLEAARARRLVLLVSAVVVRELAPAPAEVLHLLEGMPPGAVEDVPLTPEVLALRDAYLADGILGPRSSDDAAHVAAATVARADAIVSWNFRHIVRLDKMKAYNQVNVKNGYGILTILSPREVWVNEPDQD